MGGGDFGGNGSVEWHVNSHNTKAASSFSQSPIPGRPNPHRQDGVDRTKANSDFTVTIKVPKPPNDVTFLAEIQDAANNPVGGVITFTLPIEDILSGFNPPTANQIKVEWPSDPNVVPVVRLGSQRGRASARRRPEPASRRKRSAKRR